jgi:TATA-box binding protein (TBP) (component of TFIID and TFIIIB)
MTVFSDDEDFPGIDCSHISDKEFEDSEKFIIFGAHSKEQVEAYLKKNINDIKKVILVVDDTFYVLDKTNRFMNFFNASRKVWNEIS